VRFLVILLVCAPAAVAADASAPRASGWADCASAFEAARQRFGHALIEASDVKLTSLGVRVELSYGWCMHHISCAAVVQRDAGREHRWRRRQDGDNYRSTRRRQGLAGTLTCFDHNESDGGDASLGPEFIEAFEQAIDGCLDGR
jgi:hypothetical protein